jgi:glycosyltransferase involved in cell wall biosynthesis
MQLGARRQGRERPSKAPDPMAPPRSAGYRVDLSVVIPLNDEEATLETLYIGVRDVCESAQITFEIIFVDDGSADDSTRILGLLARLDRRVRPIILRRNFGKAAALGTGFRAASGRAVVTMDADLQDDPREIPALLQKLDEGWGLVSGWKQRRRDPLSRRLASRIFNWATRRLSGVKLHDFNCGLKAYTNECAKEVAKNSYGELHRYLPVFAHYKGFRVTEMPVNHHERDSGRSRYGIERYLRGFLDLFTAVFISRYGRRPMHVFGTLGLLLFMPGVAILSWVVVGKLAFGQSIGGGALLVLGAVLCIVGVQLLVAGLIGEMINSQREGGVPHWSVAVDGPVALVPAVAEMEMEENGNGNGNGHPFGNGDSGARMDSRVIIDEHSTTVILPSAEPAAPPTGYLPRRRPGLEP